LFATHGFNLFAKWIARIKNPAMKNSDYRENLVQQLSVAFRDGPLPES
jgi:hypothetical protein